MSVGPAFIYCALISVGHLVWIGVASLKTVKHEMQISSVRCGTITIQKNEELVYKSITNLFRDRTCI